MSRPDPFRCPPRLILSPAAILGRVALILLVLCALPALAAAADDPTPEPIQIDGMSFESWADFVGSQYFKRSGLRCGTPDKAARGLLYDLKVEDPSDCSANRTNPTTDYDPSALWEIPVAVHVIMDAGCSQGAISDALVQSQIDILNEDLLALSGSNGGSGTDAQIRFVLASQDPNGNSTSGITRSCNSTWFNDNGSYWNSLAWDPNRYLNIYTNQAGGNLGYVPFLPADSGGSLVGTAEDRVVVLWSSFGRNGPIGPPYNQGRTTTHEVGHYLGLEHTFNPEATCGSSTAPGCYSDVDLICDTNVEQNPGGSPCNVGASSSCGSVDPTDNYMDYSDDQCMERFTVEQIRRIRCGLRHYRPNLYRVTGSSSPPQVTITAPASGSSFPEGTAIAFAGNASDAEDGNLTAGIAWSSNRDGAIGSGGAFSATLSAGTHTVTARITDSGGLSGSAQITVTVTGTCSDGGLDETFENGLGSWTAGGLWHLASNSSCASPGYSSPVGAMYYGQDASCDYDTGAATRGNLVSPEISGITASSALSFDYFRGVESTVNDPYDATEVAVSAAAGGAWTTVWSKTSDDASPNAWTSSGPISLAAFDGQSIRLRFRFDSVDDFENGYTGWLIDDVQVTGSCDPGPGCSLPPGHADYCRECGPCDAGEGDCDGNAQCTSGLSCVNDVGADYGFPGYIDVCEAPSDCPWPPGHAHYCRDCGPCGEGEGDCDGNAQCGAGLQCVNDVGADYGFPGYIDVCEPIASCPWPLGHPHYCRDCGPCDAGEADCDGNAQCGGGLSCVNNVGADYGFPGYIDVCE